MLFLCWGSSDESERQGVAMLGQWWPAVEGDFKDLYGSGGVTINEAATVATLAATVAPWPTRLRPSVTPILPIRELTAIAGEAFTFRDWVAQAGGCFASQHT
jgi:hypothetical protein